MTKEQLKYLALLPQVIDALNAFAVEAEAVRVAAARAGFGTPPARQAEWTQPPAVKLQYLGPQGPVNIPTPERAEYRAGNPPATEEDAVGATGSTLPHLQEARQRRAQMLRQARQDPTRAEKLAQFRHDAATAEEPADDVVATSMLNLGGSNG